MTPMNLTASADDGAVLAYEDRGNAEGKPLVLLHSLGADARMWDGCLPALEHDYRVIVPELRGHGRSGPALSKSVDQWVADLHAVLSAADVDEVVLAGVSLGGIQALAFAATHTDTVAGLVVADSFAALHPDTALEKITYLIGQASESTMATVADQYVADTFTPPPPPGARSVREAIAGIDKDSYASAVEVCFGARIEDRLGDVQAPTLVLWGDRDTKTPRRLSERITDAVQDARLEVVPHAGHLSNVDNPTRFAAELAAFAAECGASPPENRTGEEG